jgi:hypothetical protein
LLDKALRSLLGQAIVEQVELVHDRNARDWQGEHKRE